MILQRNCHEFIAYENLHGVRKQAARPDGRCRRRRRAPPLTQAVPLVRRALKILADREVSPQTGLLKSTLLQLDSTFSERNYGASSFLDFTEKLAQAGVVTLKHAGRSVMVELNESFDENALKAATTDGAALPPSRPRASARQRPASSEGAGDAVPVLSPEGFGGPRPASADGFCLDPRTPTDRRPAHEIRPAPMDMPPQVGDNAEGVRVAGRILTAARNARWPMYLRNVKQILRQAEGGFDERRYGFGGLMDLLKACQREGFVRIERDRRGGLRVFQGPQLQGAAAVVRQPNLPQPDVEDAYESQPIETRTSDARRCRRNSGDRGVGAATGFDRHDGGAARTRQAEATPRAGGAADRSGQKAAAARKPAARRSTRGRKSSSSDG